MKNKVNFQKKLNKETFSLFHLNIRSLNNNIDKLNLLGLLKRKFNVIVLIEVWANETAKNNSLFQILKIRQTKIVRDEEGSVFFIRKGVNFKESEDLSKYNSNTEICSIEAENKNSKNLFQIISGVYIAP